MRASETVPHFTQHIRSIEMAGKVKALLGCSMIIGSMFSEFVLLVTLMSAAIVLGFSIIESKGDGHEY